MMLKIVVFLSVLANIAHSNIPFSHRTNPFSTHQPVLYTIAMKTSGPIIEFGCGHGSTDLLHEICKKNQRLLISIDDDLDWLNKFSQKYSDSDSWHQFFFVPGKNQNDPENGEHWTRFLEDFELLKTNYFDLCFIDQSPWSGRVETLKHMKNRARFFILHDCDYFPVSGILGKTIQSTFNQTPGIFDFSDLFRYFKVYFPLKPWPYDTGPPTLLGSDVESDLPELDYNQF
jgi:hypothetical protein